MTKEWFSLVEELIETTLTKTGDNLHQSELIGMMMQKYDLPRELVENIVKDYTEYTYE